MLENSFVHLPAISPEAEQRLWGLGYRNWDDLEAGLPEMFNIKKASKLQLALEESRAARESNDLGYFQQRFKGSEMWRILPALFDQGERERIAYLDIETTGLGFPPASHSTTIAVLFEGQLFVEHKHEMKRMLLEKIESEARCLVTFNGASFDLPFLRKEFHESGLALGQPHVDLRFWFARLERRGGLKKIQQSFPEVRQRDSMDLDGYDAVKLWRMHEWGVERALETLMTYNAEDTVVLEQLMYCALNMEAECKSHLRLPTYDLPAIPAISTRVCPEVYAQLRTQPW
jgi:uncharacterized protein